MRLNHINDQYAILTSHRTEHDPSTNDHHFSQLESELRQKGYMPKPVQGEWRGKREPALKIDGISLEVAKELATKYNQEAILYCGPETQNEKCLVYRDGTVKSAS